MCATTSGERAIETAMPDLVTAVEAVVFLVTCFVPVLRMEVRARRRAAAHRATDRRR